MSSAAGEGSQTSPAPSSPQARDYLSDLPVELLRQVLTLAWPKQHNVPTAPISKHLHPLLLERLYEQPKVTSYASLARLCETVKDNAAYGVLIKQLNVEIPWVVEGTKTDPTKEQSAPTAPAKKDVVALLRSMKKTKKIVLEGSTRLASIILHPEVASDVLPELEDLFLCSTFSNAKDPFHPALFAALPWYSQLDTFGLIVERTATSLKPSLKPLPPSAPTFFPPMFRLVLDGPVAQSPSACTLLASFEDIFDLSLCDLRTTASLIPLLEAIGKPESICHLSLQTVSDVYDPKIKEVLARFATIEELELSGGTASPSPSLYDIFRKLPLEALTLGPGAGASTDVELAALIAADCRNVPYSGGAREDWGIYPDWVLPSFTETFTRKGLKDLVRLAEGTGVELDGDALAAIAVDEAFDAECDWVSAFETAVEESWDYGY
ncbi:hypothetical protein JCM10213_002859 [Rhodosporidiobolus nylandii]